MKSTPPNAEQLATSAARAWQQAVVKLNASKADIVPAEYKSREELQKIWNVGKSVATCNLKCLLKAGLAEKKNFKVLHNETIHVVPRYKLL